MMVYPKISCLYFSFEDDFHNSALSLAQLDVSPYPIRISSRKGSNITLSIHGSSRQLINNVDMKVEITRLNTIFGDIKFPCLPIAEVGSW